MFDSPFVKGGILGIVMAGVVITFCYLFSYFVNWLSKNK